jgi:hypothetical protein
MWGKSNGGKVVKMDKKAELLKEIKGMLIGLKVCYIGQKYGGYLKIGLGEKVYYDETGLKGKFHCQCDVSSRQSTWRIIQNNKILCGYGNEVEFNKGIFSSLELGSLVDIIQKTDFDITFMFDCGISVDFICNILEEPQLTITSYPTVAYELCMDGWRKIDPNELFRKVSEIDSVLSDLSEDCCNRWNSMVPKSKNNKVCDNCFYFRTINGYFHFWEFGICSNRESPFDGKLVGVSSGCNELKALKDLIK